MSLTTSPSPPSASKYYKNNIPRFSFNNNSFKNNVKNYRIGKDNKIFTLPRTFLGIFSILSALPTGYLLFRKIKKDNKTIYPNITIEYCTILVNMKDIYIDGYSKIKWDNITLVGDYSTNNIFIVFNFQRMPIDKKIPDGLRRITIPIPETCYLSKNIKFEPTVVKGVLTSLRIVFAANTIQIVPRVMHSIPSDINNIAVKNHQKFISTNDLDNLKQVIHLLKLLVKRKLLYV